MNKIKRFSLLTIFIALVIVLQIISTFVNFGGFPITLTLIPIILSGIILGKKEAAIVGFFFGVVVCVMVITGSDPSGATMLSLHPFITIFTCLLKGTLAGYFSSLVYGLISKNNEKLALIVSSIIAPITNTLILTISIVLFFQGNLQTFILLFISINFLIELLTNVLLAPGLYVLIKNKLK